MSDETKKDTTLLRCLQDFQEFYREKQRTEEYISGIVWGDVNRSVSFHGEKILDVIRAANGENGKIYFLYPTKGYTIIKGNGCYLLAEDRENNLNKEESLWMRTLKYLKNFTRAICSKMSKNKWSKSGNVANAGDSSRYDCSGTTRLAHADYVHLND